MAWRRKDRQLHDDDFSRLRRERARKSRERKKKYCFETAGSSSCIRPLDEGGSRGKPQACVARMCVTYTHTRFVCTHYHVRARARAHICHLHRRRKQTSEVVERERQKEYEVATAADRRRCARLRSCEGGRTWGGRGGRGVERERERDIGREDRRGDDDEAAMKSPQVEHASRAQRRGQVISSDR